MVGRKQTRSSNIRVNISPEQKAKLKQAAAKQGQSMTDYVHSRLFPISASAPNSHPFALRRLSSADVYRILLEIGNKLDEHPQSEELSDVNELIQEFQREVAFGQLRYRKIKVG